MLCKAVSRDSDSNMKNNSLKIKEQEEKLHSSNIRDPGQLFFGGAEEDGKPMRNNLDVAESHQEGSSRGPIPRF